MDKQDKWMDTSHNKSKYEGWGEFKSLTYIHLDWSDKSSVGDLFLVTDVSFLFTFSLHLMDESVRSELGLNKVHLLFWSTALSIDGLFLMVVAEAAWDRTLHKHTTPHFNTRAEGRNLKSNLTPDLNVSTVRNNKEKQCKCDLFSCFISSLLLRP